MTCIAVWSGFYSAYYANTKHAKSPSKVIRSILDMQSRSTKDKSRATNDVDMSAEIEKFARRDLQFLSAQKEGKLTCQREIKK